MKIRHGGDPLLVALLLSPKLNFGMNSTEEFREGLRYLLASVILCCIACSCSGSDTSDLCQIQRMVYNFMMANHLNDHQFKEIQEARRDDEDGEDMVTEEDIDNMFL